MANHITVAPGAAFALDALLYNICDPGDGVLVPTPYWSKQSSLISLAYGSPFNGVVPTMNRPEPQAVFQALHSHIVSDAIIQTEVGSRLS